MFETLLLNFLFLLIPLVIFLIFFEDRPQPFNRKMLVLLAIVTMSLCMLMPIKLNVGYTVDLRYIPFIIVGLYGGYRSLIPLYLALNIFRFFISWHGFIPSLIYSTIALLILPLCCKRFLKLSPKGRVMAAMVVSVLTLFSYLISLVIVTGQIDREFWILTISILPTYLGVTGIIMLLIEKILFNMQSRDKILQSERLNVVSELAASVSHEMRNPLTVTSGFLQLLKKSTAMTHQDREFIEMSLEELRRAEQIITDFLSYAKPQSKNMVYSNLKAELEYTHKLIKPYAAIHEVEVQFQFNNTLNTNYDRNQIQQGLINLYKNGIEAMREKGGGTLHIHVAEKKQNIVISIRDTGIGMTKEEIARLGKPYYSTKAEGTGLGMLMVYSTVHKLKGNIEVQSEKGKGTTFVITVPAQPPGVTEDAAG